jgi:hypothetical protein
MRPGHVFNQSHPTGAEFKNEWSYASAPTVRLQVVDAAKIIFTYVIRFKHMQSEVLTTSLNKGSIRINKSHVTVIWRAPTVFTRCSTASFVCKFCILRATQTLILPVVWYILLKISIYCKLT